MKPFINHKNIKIGNSDNLIAASVQNLENKKINWYINTHLYILINI